MNFATYLRKLSASLDGKSITADAIESFNTFITNVTHTVTEEAGDQTKKKGRVTLFDKDMTVAISIIFEGKLGEQMNKAGVDALSKFSAYKNMKKKDTTGKKKEKTKAVSASTKAGIIFPPARIKNLMKENWKNKFSGVVHIYMAAAMEALVSELMEESFKETARKKRKRITSAHINTVLEENEEFANAMKKINL